MALVEIIIAAVASLAIMLCLWLAQRRTGNAGIVDVGWSLLVGVIGVAYAVFSDGYGLRRAAAGAMIGVWALRLGLYLWRDRVAGRPEEGRYAELRRRWGTAAQQRFLAFFMMQAVAAVFFSLPVLVAVGNPRLDWSGWDWAAVAVWCFAVGNTALADRQLARFKSNPEHRGQTCRLGWWRYSRHPNYFFEWLHWWSYVLLAIGSPWLWVSISVAMTMLYFLLFVTGIPPTEAQALASRGDDYRRYMRSTSAFVPWFPKREEGS